MKRCPVIEAHLLSRSSSSIFHALPLRCPRFIARVRPRMESVAEPPVSTACLLIDKPTLVAVKLEHPELGAWHAERCMRFA
jgi:hypothetical protein